MQTDPIQMQTNGNFVTIKVKNGRKRIRNN